MRTAFRRFAVDVILVTYRIVDEPHARSSIWCAADGRWQMVFIRHTIRSGGHVPCAYSVVGSGGREHAAVLGDHGVAAVQQVSTARPGNAGIAAGSGECVAIAALASRHQAGGVAAR